MSAYLTEEEQLERMKQWWVKYGTPLIVFISIILMLWAGYRYWDWHQSKVLGEASKIYENLMLAASKEDSKGLRAFANELIQEYPKTVYADIARLSLAKFEVERGKYATAKPLLAAVSSHSNRMIFKELANIRMARILVAEKAFNEALMLLKKVNGSPYAPIIHELEGDIYAASSKLDKALGAYQLAVKELQLFGTSNVFLEMKMNDLAVRIENSSAGAGSDAVPSEPKIERH